MEASEGDRFDMVWSELGLGSDKLCEGELLKVKDVLYEFRDVFALNDTELGHTSIVQHSIDTGDHAPIKQIPCRMPLFRH